MTREATSPASESPPHVLRLQPRVAAMHASDAFASHLALFDPLLPSGRMQASVRSGRVHRRGELTDCADEESWT